MISAVIILLRYPLSQPVRLTALPKGEPRGAAEFARKLQFILWWNESSEIYKSIESFGENCKGLADCKENVKKQLQCAARVGILMYHGKIWDI